MFAAVAASTSFVALCHKTMDGPRPEWDREPETRHHRRAERP
jgi:hypothetical protein